MHWFLIPAGLSELPGGTLKIQASELMVSRDEGLGGEVGKGKGIM